ncbi:MAG: hypothetical protein IT376_16520 [Polyangiaceae bacterium]|nr:hypothetical protein [Polyangiaceae bacterium]
MATANGPRDLGPRDLGPRDLHPGPVVALVGVGDWGARAVHERTVRQLPERPPHVVMRVCVASRAAPRSTWDAVVMADAPRAAGFGGADLRAFDAGLVRAPVAILVDDAAPSRAGLLGRLVAMARARGALTLVCVPDDRPLPECEEQADAVVALGVASRPGTLVDAGVALDTLLAGYEDHGIIGWDTEDWHPLVACSGRATFRWAEVAGRPRGARASRAACQALASFDAQAIAEAGALGILVDGGADLQIGEVAMAVEALTRDLHDTVSVIFQARPAQPVDGVRVGVVVLGRARAGARAAGGIDDGALSAGSAGATASPLARGTAGGAATLER